MIFGSPSERFVNRELGVLLDLQRKSNTLLTSVSISGLLADLLETKLSMVFRIPSITYKKTQKCTIIYKETIKPLYKKLQMQNYIKNSI
jgi:hypothetical protein